MPVVIRDLRYQRGLWVRGWSPGSQAPIATQDIRRAKRFNNVESFKAWLKKQPGASNYVGDGLAVLFSAEPAPLGEDS